MGATCIVKPTASCHIVPVANPGAVLSYAGHDTVVKMADSNAQIEPGALPRRQYSRLSSLGNNNGKLLFNRRLLLQDGNRH